MVGGTRCPGAASMTASRARLCTPDSLSSVEWSFDVQSAATAGERAGLVGLDPWRHPGARAAAAVEAQRWLGAENSGQAVDAARPRILRTPAAIRRRTRLDRGGARWHDRRRPAARRPGHLGAAPVRPARWLAGCVPAQRGALPRSVSRPEHVPARHSSPLDGLTPEGRRPRTPVSCRYPRWDRDRLCRRWHASDSATSPP